MAYTFLPPGIDNFDYGNLLGYGAGFNAFIMIQDSILAKIPCARRKMVDPTEPTLNDDPNGPAAEDSSSAAAGEDEWKDDDFLQLSQVKKPPAEEPARERPSRPRQDDEETSRMIPPWMSGKQASNLSDDRRRHMMHPMNRLHNEIVHFVNLMEPRPLEVQQREQFVQDFMELAKETFEGKVRLNIPRNCLLTPLMDKRLAPPTTFNSLLPPAVQSRSIWISSYRPLLTDFRY